MERVRNIFSFGKFGKGKKSLKATPDDATELPLAYKLKEKDLGKLHKAARDGDLHELQYLVIHQKKDINKRDQKGRTALHIACALGQDDVVQFLVDAKAALNLCDGQHRTALMKAVQGQHENCVILLVDNGADVEYLDKDGNTALHLAASSKSSFNAWLLATRDADINALNNEGLSPLSMAVRADNAEMAEILLKNKADARAAADETKLPLTIATVNEMHAMTQLLLSFSQCEPASDMSEGEASQAEEYSEDGPQSETASLNSRESEIEPESQGEPASDMSEGEASQAEEDPEDGPQSDTASLDSRESEIEPESVGEEMMEAFVKDRNSNSDDPWENDDEIYLEIEKKTKELRARGKMMDQSGIRDPDDNRNTPARYRNKRPDWLLESDEDEPSHNAVSTIPKSHTSTEKETHLNKMCPDKKELLLNSGSDDAEAEDSDEEQPRIENESDENSWGSFYDDTSMEKINTPASESGEDEPPPNTSTLLPSFLEKEISADKELEDVDLPRDEQSLDRVFTIPKPDTSKGKNRDFMSESRLTDEESEQESSESEDFSGELHTVKRETGGVRKSNTDDLNSRARPRKTEITPRKPHSHEDSDCDTDCPSDNEMMEVNEWDERKTPKEEEENEQLNLLQEYKSTIQKLKNKNSYLLDKVNQLEMDKEDLKNSLDEVKEIKPQLELQTEVVHLKKQLEQKQESHRKVTEAYITTEDMLKRTEEQRQLEIRERLKMEVTLRNQELEMRTLVNNTKQLEEETRKLTETLKLLAQKSSARSLQDDVLNSHPHKQQEVKEGDELQTSTLQEQIRNLRGELARFQANSSLSENHLLEENETLKGQLREAQREVKANTETVFNCKHQLSTLKSDLDIMTTRFENEKQARETLEKEVDSTRTGFAAAVQEVEQCMAAKADVEKHLLREKKERQIRKNRLVADQASHREEVSSLSLKLSKAESENNSLEEEQRRLTIQLTEMRLLLDELQKEKEVEELDKAFQSQTEQPLNTGVHRAQEQLAQAQGEAMLLHQQLDEANKKCEVKEKALTDAQRKFSDKLSKVRFDYEEKVSLVEGRNKKLTRKATELQDQVFKLEEEKACALKDLVELKDQHVQSEKGLTEEEEELGTSVQTLKESQSGSSAPTDTAERLEEALQRLERIKKKARKISEQKTKVESCLDQEKNRNSELQKEMDSLRESLKTAEKSLNDLDMKGETNSSMKNATEEEDFKTQLDRMKKKARKISEQKANVEARLDQEKNKNSELQKEMHSLRESLKTAEKRPSDLDMRGATHSSMNLDARKAQNLEIQLEREILRRRQLEKDNIILGEEAASLKRSEQYHLDELHELRRRMDFTQREKSQSEGRIRHELQQVNRLLETQTASQRAKDQTHANNQASLQTQLEQRIRTLESEASRAQTTLMDSLSQQDSTRIELEKYKSMYSEESLLRKSLADKLERAKSKLLSERKSLMASNPLNLSPANQGQN